MDGLWRGVIYGLEPQVVIAAAAGQPLAEANPFFAVAPPPLAFLAWVVVWTALVLSVSPRSRSTGASPEPSAATSAVSRGQPRYRKQPGRWSSTRPTLCMNA